MFAGRSVDKSQEIAVISLLSSLLRDFIINKWYAMICTFRRVGIFMLIMFNNHSSIEELQYLRQLNVIAIEQLQEILACRSISVTSSSTVTGKQDEEWDPIGSDDEIEDNDKTRLELELYDTIYAYIDEAIRLIQSSRTTRHTTKSQQRSFDETDILCSYSHAINLRSSVQIEAQDYGLLGRSLHAILKYIEMSLIGDRLGKKTYSLSNFHHVESSLAQLKRAGLGLLTSGLGKLGLGSPGSAAPHPGDNNIIVIFVVGGISFEEVGQLKRLIENADRQLTKNFKVYMGGNDIFQPSDLFKKLA